MAHFCHFFHHPFFGTLTSDRFKAMLGIERILDIESPEEDGYRFRPALDIVTLKVFSFQSSFLMFFVFFNVFFWGFNLQEMDDG